MDLRQIVELTQGDVGILKEVDEGGRPRHQCRLLHETVVIPALLLFDQFLANVFSILLEQFVEVGVYPSYEWLLRLNDNLLCLLLSEEFVLQICEEAFTMLLVVFLRLDWLLNTLHARHALLPLLRQDRSGPFGALVLEDKLLALLLAQVFIEKGRDHRFDTLRLLRLCLASGNFSCINTVGCLRARHGPPGWRSLGDSFGIDLCRFLWKTECLRYWFEVEAVLRYWLQTLRLTILHQNLLKKLHLLLFFDIRVLAGEQSQHFLFPLQCRLLRFACDTHSISSVDSATHHHLLAQDIWMFRRGSFDLLWLR